MSRPTMQRILITTLLLSTQLAPILAFYASSRYTVNFPLRNVQRSINLLSPNSQEVYLPSGKCEDYPDRNLSLILPQCGLEKVVLGFIESCYVSCLSLRDNWINKISSGAFEDLPNLLYLDISKNRLAYCDLLTFGGHRKLGTLVLDENDASGDDRPHEILDSDCFPRLNHLYLRKNRLRTLKFSFETAFPQLTHLYMSDNLIESEDFIRNPPVCLKHLHLERNRICEFGGYVLRNIMSLFLEGNSIRTLCNSHCTGLKLRGAERLKFLSLASNGLTNVEYDSFSEACGLVSLNLAHNKIVGFSLDTFTRLTLLQDLNLEDNCIRDVPNLIRNTELRTVLLGKNEISRIESGAFRDLTRLKWLSLNDNRIRIIECDAFVNLRSLEELDLSNNRLDHLPTDWIRPQSSLRHLDLTGNLFTCLENLSLESAAYLTHVYMQNNPVTSVKICSERALAWFSTDVVVHLTNGCRVVANPCYETCYSEDKRLYHRRISSWWV